MIFKKYISVALFFIATISSSAQVHDDFNDGEFDTSPQWHGDIDLFVIEDGILRSSGNPETDNIFLSTALVGEIEHWQLFLKLDFAPSGSNKFRFYLIADSLNLLNSTAAVYLEIGQTGDDVFRLIRKAGINEEELIVSKKVFHSNVEENIRVSFIDSKWSLSFLDETGDYIQDTSVVSNFPIIEKNAYTGLKCFHTSTRRDKFYFDDFYAGPIIKDTIPPTVTNVSFLDSRNIEINFSEIIEQPVVESILINGTQSEQILMSSAKGIVVTSSTDFTEEGNALSLENILDKSNNVINDTTIHFSYYEVSIPMPGEIVINEIMADPSPPIDLPEAEFIELWNISEKHFDLSELQINGKVISKTTNLLKRKSYVILCKYTDIELFEGFDNVVGMDSWNILSNAGDNIALIHYDGEVLDEVNYTVDWYASELKSKGGFSLERKYITYPCDQQFNWEASISESGGSPGLVNSVSNKPSDIAGPRIQEIYAVDSSNIEVIFDEPINPSSFQVSDVSSENTVFITHKFEDGKTIALNVLKPLEVNKIYKLAFKEISDCAGNQMTEQNATVVLPDKIEPGDIVLNEILFDPYPSGVDYLELYNTTNKFLDIQPLTVSNDTVTFYNIANKPYILRPHQYLAITTDTNRVINDYPQTKEILNVDALPGMPNDGGELFLFNGMDTLDYFQYSPDMHIKFLQNTEGVSLERISANSKTNEPDNWHSAASSAGFGTPGFVNSQASTTKENEKRVFLSYSYITPNHDGDKDFLEINYFFDQPGFIATISIYSPRGDKIKSLTNNLILAQRGHIKWNGDNDFGEILKTGHYIVVAQVYNTSGESQVYKEKIVVLN